MRLEKCTVNPFRFSYLHNFEASYDQKCFFYVRAPLYSSTIGGHELGQIAYEIITMNG